MTKLFLFTLALSLSVERPRQDPYKVAPENYRMEFENDFTRVSRATLRPGDKIPVHDHPHFPTVYVYLTDGGRVRFTHISPAFSIERPEVKAGAIRINRAPEESHEVEYLGSAASEYLRIEMKPKSITLTQRTSRLAAEDPGPFEDPGIRIRRISCAEASRCIAAHPTVVVSVDKRDAYWVPAAESLLRDGSASQQLILVEFTTTAE